MKFGSRSILTQFRLPFGMHYSDTQGQFAVYLEVFSLLSFKEMKTYISVSSPEPAQAFPDLIKSLEFKQGDVWTKGRVSLRCGDRGHLMQVPVSGKNCKHVEVILFILYFN